MMDVWRAVFLQGPGVCFLTLQILPSPLISCLPCSMFDPGKNTSTYPPLWKEWEYLYLSKWWKHGSQRENDSHRSEVQPWSNSPATAEKKREWTHEPYKHVCITVSIQIGLIKKKKKLLVSKASESERILMDCKSFWRKALWGIKRDSCPPRTANGMIQEIPLRHKVVWGAKRLHV